MRAQYGKILVSRTVKWVQDRPSQLAVETISLSRESYVRSEDVYSTRPCAAGAHCTASHRVILELLFEV